jgi:hypothetical protein
LANLCQCFGERHLAQNDARPPRFPFHAIRIIFKLQGGRKRGCSCGVGPVFRDESFKEIKQYGIDRWELSKKSWPANATRLTRGGLSSRFYSARRRADAVGCSRLILIQASPCTY